MVLVVGVGGWLWRKKEGSKRERRGLCRLCVVFCVVNPVQNMCYLDAFVDCFKIALTTGSDRIK